MNDVRLPPANGEAEEAVLGSIMIEPNTIYDVISILDPGDFYLERARTVYKAMLFLSTDETALDLLTISNYLSQTDALDEIGGQAYLIGLINAVPTSVNVEHYARIVRDAAVRRKIIHAAQETANMAYDTPDHVEVLRTAEDLFFGLADRAQRNNPLPMKQVAESYLDQVYALSEKEDGVGGIKTGFYDLDRLLGGFQRGEFTIIAGRPSMGKTAFMLETALNAARSEEKYSVAIFSLEMSTRQLMHRLVSTQLNIPVQSLNKGRLETDEWEKFNSMIGQLSEHRIFVDQTGRMTPAEFRAKCHRLQMLYGLDLVILDYLQLMHVPGEQRRVQEMSIIGKSISSLAKELDVPMVCASQLSRGVESRQNKRPMLSDLRDSGTLEEDADVVMFLYRDEYYNPDTSDRPNVAELDIAKNRNGPKGVVVDLYFKYGRFHNLERKQIYLGKNGASHSAAFTSTAYETA